jgi:tricorn protease
MWHGDTIYFDSDRGPEHRLNLYSYSLATKQIKQLTNFTDFDCNWPSLGPDSIVFENGGYLYVFDLNTQQAHKLTVELPGDLDQARPHWVEVKKLITDFDVAPDGKRGVFTARGDIFTVPAKEGSIRDLTRTSGIREKYAAWSPDGRWVAFISDRTGEDELYITPQDGLGEEVRITLDGKMFRLPPVWAPDSRKLVFADKEARLWYVDIDQKEPAFIDQSKYGDVTDYAFSPDSNWVAYSKATENQNHVIELYNLANRKITAVTTNASDSTAPYFDPEGKYLYFFSNRDFNEVIGVYDIGFANPKAGRVYIVTLKADEPSPFPVLSDEVTTRQAPDVLLAPTPATLRPPEKPPQAPPSAKSPAKPPEKPPTTEEKAKAEVAKAEEQPGTRPPLKAFRVDLQGIEHRIVALPIPPGNLQNLAAAKDLIFYVTAPIQGLSGPLPGETPTLHVYDLK